ncbi:MAG TPA: DUF4352 domain-containing protein [Micromonosporaceae bacterium]|nr:DUF4352 domain-containing protein [Micromonosporaceae bacterium]
MSTSDPGPAVPQPKKRRWPIILALMGGVLALCCVGGIIAMIVSNSGSSSATDTTNVDSPADGTVGSPVRDGKFEFVVKKVECGKRSVGTGSLRETAQGQYCLVSLSVKNIGKEPQTLSDSNQKAFAPDGVEYGTDSVASLYANGDNNVWLNEINPGNQVTGILVFDIPSNARIARLELHDSAFSGGVDVKVD